MVKQSLYPTVLLRQDIETLMDAVSIKDKVVESALLLTSNFSSLETPSSDAPALLLPAICYVVSQHVCTQAPRPLHLWRL